MESHLPRASRLFVTFRSTAFNTSAPEKHFVSVRSYGSDVANWLVNELALRDAASQPAIAQKDGGWVVRFEFGRASYDFVVRFQDPDWVGFLERKQSIVARLLGRARKHVEPEAASLLDTMLASSGLISEIRWAYEDGFHLP